MRTLTWRKSFCLIAVSATKLQTNFANQLTGPTTASLSQPACLLPYCFLFFFFFFFVFWESDLQVSNDAIVFQEQSTKQKHEPNGQASFFLACGLPPFVVVVAEVPSSCIRREFVMVVGGKPIMCTVGKVCSPSKMMM